MSRWLLLVPLVFLALVVMAQVVPSGSTDVAYLHSATDVTAEDSVICGGDVELGGVIRLPDAGIVPVPNGVAINAGAFLCLDGSPPCNYRIYKSVGNQLVLNGAGQPVACIDGFQALGTIEGGSSQANSCEMVGGATSCTLRSASGTGATPDAGLRLQAGLPDGVVEVVNDAGITTRMALIVPRAAADIPACTAALAGAKTMFVIGPSVAVEQTCDGEHWITARNLLNLYAPPKATAGAFYRLDAPGPFEVQEAFGSIAEDGLGAGTFEVVARQGARVACRGGTTCTAASPSSFELACTGITVYASPDAGIEHAFLLEFDGGCAQMPSLNITPVLNSHGFPDEGWSVIPP